MNNNTFNLFLITIFISSFSFANEFSAMTLNVDNLFDTLDDKNKDDKAYLPIEAKTSKNHIKSCNRIKVKSWKNECLFLDWDIETKNVKLKNLASNIISYDKTGADIIALQEVENFQYIKSII
jgi:hypothetical protein